MSAMNMPVSVAVMALVAIFNLVTGAFLLFKIKEFAVKAVLTAGVSVLALASRAPEFSELLATTMWPMVVVIAAITAIIVICDFIRVAMRLDRRTTRRCGTRRTTPARH